MKKDLFLVWFEIVSVNVIDLFFYEDLGIRCICLYIYRPYIKLSRYI